MSHESLGKLKTEPYVSQSYSHSLFAKFTVQDMLLLISFLHFIDNKIKSQWAMLLSRMAPLTFYQTKSLSE